MRMKMGLNETKIAPMLSHSFLRWVVPEVIQDITQEILNVEKRALPF